VSAPEGGPGLAERPAPRPWGSLGLNLGLVLLGGAWLAILVTKGEMRFERWLASIALVLVGATGLVGPRRGGKRKSSP
jgi:hypothetical protein